MGLRQVSVSSFYQANFPISQTGKLSDIYYTIYNEDGTIHTTRTQTNIKEFGEGANPGKRG